MSDLQFTIYHDSNQTPKEREILDKLRKQNGRVTFKFLGHSYEVTEIEVHQTRGSTSIYSDFRILPTDRSKTRVYADRSSL